MLYSLTQVVSFYYTLFSPIGRYYFFPAVVPGFPAKFYGKRIFQTIFHIASNTDQKYRKNDIFGILLLLNPLYVAHLDSTSVSAKLEICRASKSPRDYNLLIIIIHQLWSALAPSSPSHNHLENHKDSPPPTLPGHLVKFMGGGVLPNKFILALSRGSITYYGGCEQITYYGASEPFTAFAINRWAMHVGIQPQAHHVWFPRVTYCIAG